MLPLLPGAGGCRRPPRAALRCRPYKTLTAGGSTAARTADTKAERFGVVPLCSAEGWRGRSGVAQPRAEARPLRLYFEREAPGVGNRTGPLRGRLTRPTFPLCAGDQHVTIPWMTAAVSHRARAVHASSANTRSSRSRITTKKCETAASFSPNVSSAKAPPLVDRQLLRITPGVSLQLDDKGLHWQNVLVDLLRQVGNLSGQLSHAHERADTA